MRNRSGWAFAASAATLLATAFTGAGTASAAPAEPTVSQQTVLSESCVDQVQAIAVEKDVAADTSLCAATVTTTETAPQIATVAQAEAIAASQDLSAQKASDLIAAAAAGGITYRDWTHTYWGGSLIEKHKGRTYWDGSKAWISSYRGYAGSHTCHSEGGLAVGWAVSPISCSKPGAGASADAFYRFDASVAFQGSPVTLNIGLHYTTAASGAASTSQVGG